MATAMAPINVDISDPLMMLHEVDLYDRVETVLQSRIKIFTSETA